MDLGLISYYDAQKFLELQFGDVNRKYDDVMESVS